MPTWRNWHETVTVNVNRYENLRNPDESRSTLAGYNDTTDRCLAMIEQAAEQDKTLRAAGAAWSFTPIAATDDTILGTQRLNYRFTLDPTFLHQTYPSGSEPVLVQAGMSIADINKYLARRGQALPTSGASNGQTIAGALATGTHGAAIDVGSVPEYVVALHIATGTGPSVWLERPSHPVLKDEIIQRLGAVKPANMSDELYNAALVSFGSFGVILGVVIEPVPLYYLHAFRDTITESSQFWTDIAAGDFDALTLPGANGRRPRHLEFARNPYGSDPKQLFATVKYFETTRPNGAKKPKSGFGKSDDTLGVIGAIGDAFSGATEFAAKLFDKAYAPYKDIAGTPGEIFSDTSTRGRSASSGVGVPLDKVKDAYNLSVDIIRDEMAPAIVALRFVKETNATLGFTRFAPATCVLDIDGANSHRVRRAHKRIWNQLREDGIAHTFHWGKLNDLDESKVKICYNTAVDEWKKRRREIFQDDDNLKRVFSNDFTDALGLSD